MQRRLRRFDAPLKSSEPMYTLAMFIFVAQSFSSHSRHQLQAVNCVAALRLLVEHRSLTNVTLIAEDQGDYICR